MAIVNVKNCVKRHVKTVTFNIGKMCVKTAYFAITNANFSSICDTWRACFAKAKLTRFFNAQLGTCPPKGNPFDVKNKGGF